MLNLKFANAYLNAIQQKHEDYFKDHDLLITNCVKITGKYTVSLVANCPDLPAEILRDVEAMFWVH